MTAQEYAERYKGRRAKLLEGADFPAGSTPDEEVIVSIVGHTIDLINSPINLYKSEQVVVIFEDKKFKTAEWNGQPNNGRFQFLVEGLTRGWRVPIECLELMEDVIIKPVKLYSQKCVYCKSSAITRRGKTLACSNVKCKSWRWIRKNALVKKAVNKDCGNCGFGASKEDPIVLICAQCYTNSKIDTLDGKNNYYECRCGNRTPMLYEVGKWYRYGCLEEGIRVTQYVGSNNKYWINS